MADHVLVHNVKKWRCTVCGAAWNSKPRTECPGLPRYGWKEWPEHMIRAADLFQRGLRLADGQPAVAVVGEKNNWTKLYDVSQAVPLEKIIEFKNGKYTFEEHEGGFQIWRVNGLSLDVRYAETFLAVGKDRIGLYEFREALRRAATWFAEQLVSRDGDIEHAADLIGGALRKRFFDGWKRIVEEIAPPSVAELSRLMWASTQGDAELLHYGELYSPRWQFVRADLRAFHACRMFARADNPIVEWPPVDYTNEQRLERVAHWREHLTPTVPNKALNQTLDKLPMAVSWPHITRLSTIELRKPVTNRLHLVFILCASGHHNWGLHARTVLDATPEMIKQVGHLYGHELKAQSRTRVIGDLASSILDYPEEYAGDLLGLARRSRDWHERFDRVGADMLPADTPLIEPRDVDLAALEEQGIMLLRTAGDCYQEHDKMRHCVHTYASKAARGLCYLFHVEYAVWRDGKPNVADIYHATVEVLADGQVTQAHGPANMKNPACHYGVETLSKAFEHVRSQWKR